jgi:hypothetical protein
MRRSLIIAILLLTGLCSLVQAGQYVFTDYTTAQGLAHNGIPSIMAGSRCSKIQPLEGKNLLYADFE